MRILLYLSASVLVVVCATWAYRVNYATQEAMDRVADLQNDIADEREAIEVLDAEWAYLNRPDRLRELVNANASTLALVELTPDQFGDVSMVPFPPEPTEEQAVAAAVAAGVTRVATAERSAPQATAPQVGAPAAVRGGPLARPAGASR
jgi:hypothetical protein